MHAGNELELHDFTGSILFNPEKSKRREELTGCIRIDSWTQETNDQSLWLGWKIKIAYLYKQDFRISSINFGGNGHHGTLAALSVLEHKYSYTMNLSDLSSLKWGKNGELSANDSLHLVERLTKAEQEMKSSDKKILNSSSLKNNSEEVAASWRYIT